MRRKLRFRNNFGQSAEDIQPGAAEDVGSHRLTLAAVGNRERKRPRRVRTVEDRRAPHLVPVVVIGGDPEQGDDGCSERPLEPGGERDGGEGLVEDVEGSEEEDGLVPRRDERSPPPEDGLEARADAGPGNAEGLGTERGTAGGRRGGRGKIAGEGEKVGVAGVQGGVSDGAGAAQGPREDLRVPRRVQRVCPIRSRRAESLRNGVPS